MNVQEQATAGSARLRRDDLRRYWSNLSQGFLSKDPEGLAVICCAGMPPWFNRFLDRYQRMAFNRLVGRLDVRGAEVLDLGTGVGRWAHWFAARGAARVVGVDIEKQRLDRARERAFGPIEYEQMSVDRLSFADRSFDLVNSVTVLQHVDHDVKAAALKEIGRVLRPGGHAVLFELTDMDDDAPHVFPETGDAWIAMCRAQGLRLVRTNGDQYTPLLRVAKAAVGRVAGRSSRRRIDGFKAVGPDRSNLQPSSLALRALVLMSYPLEEICQRALPGSAAKIGGFLFRKDATPAPPDGRVL